MSLPAEGVVCPQHHGALPGPLSGRAVFLDRDGVLIEDTGYPDDPDTIRILPGAPEALRRLRDAGWRLIVVSNQSGVARGKFDLERLAAIHDSLLARLAAEGATLDAIFFCPHHPAGVAPFAVECDHRKPLPGMIRSAAERLQLNVRRSWLVGDRESDIAAGQAAGARTVLIGGGETAANLRAAHLLDAAMQILARDQSPDA